MTAGSRGGRRWVGGLLSTAVALAVWFAGPPEGLAPPAWHLAGLFVGAILAVLTGALPVLPASLLALSAAVLTRTVPPEKAYAGFSQGPVLLIVAAFLVARAVGASGLGRRVALHVIRRLGGSTLGLGYGLFLTDAVLAPFFPSNTARAGLLYPLVASLARECGSEPGGGQGRAVGRYLMMAGMASLSVSSTLWLTAMAANPVGARMAAEAGVKVGFGSWFLGALAPCAVALLLLPWLVHRLLPPGRTATAEATALAERALREAGPLTRREGITLATALVMLAGWALGGSLGLDPAAVALGGLVVLLATGALPPAELRSQGEALVTMLWFAALYALSAQLDALGFMRFLGDRLALGLGGWSWGAAYAALVGLYVALHYLFVSQTAHLVGLFGVFLAVGCAAGVPAPLLAPMLLYATNFFSVVTPQGSSANVLFAGSGYLTSGEMYACGAAVTAANLAVFLAVGTPWLLWLGAR